MAKKKTQTELLEEIKEMLLPISNLSRYYIQSINAQLKAQEEAKKEGENEGE